MRTRATRAPRGRTGLAAAIAAGVILALGLAGCHTESGGAAAGPTRFPILEALVATDPTPSTAPTASAPPQPSAGPSPSASPEPSAGPPATPDEAAPPDRLAPPPPAGPAAPPPAAPAGAGRIRPGVVYTGPATWYDANGDGNCLFGPSSDPAMPVVAINELDYDHGRSCGAFLEVTGPGGTTVVKVTDRCPECPAGHLDLSRQAFERIAGGRIGRIDQVSWRLVSPAEIGPVQFKVKRESSQWWLALQVRDHRNPVVSLEVRRGDTWVTVPRQMWNYFEAEGLGPGPYTVRVTDLYGEQLVGTVQLAPDTVQPTDRQFARH